MDTPDPPAACGNTRCRRLPPAGQVFCCPPCGTAAAAGRRVRAHDPACDQHQAAAAAGLP